MAGQPVTRYAKTDDGVHLAYQVLGEGPFDLVFVPDWVSHIEWAWEYPPYARLLHRLASFCRLIWFDKRGLGLSDRPDRLPTLEDQMADIGVVMDAAGSERAALFGATDGTAMSVAFAASHPERVRALVTYGAIPRILQAPDYPSGFSQSAMDFYLRWVEEFWGQDQTDYIELFAPTMVNDRAFRTWHAQLCRLAASPASIIEILRVWSLHDVRAILPAVRVPTLVVNRSDDGRMDAARYIVEHIPGARLTEVPGSDSLIYAGDADAVIDEVQEFLTGVRDAPESDRVLATVLFTDIVGSTQLATRLGDRRWRELLDAHDASVDRQLNRYRGTKVKSTGDGMLARFDGPARAIRCAEAIVGATRALSIDVRAGLHTGEIDVRVDDVGGIAVHIGARVAELADAGEILVSRTVTELVAGSGISFRDRGQHDLKGVTGQWQLFSVDPGVLEVAATS
jgi:class 3 adenylate cyclase